MSGTSFGGIGSVLVQGWTTMLTTLQNIQQSIANLVTAINTLAIGASANNIFTGDNDFLGTNTFKPPPIISAGAVGTGTVMPEGLLSVQTSRSGIGNGANTTDDVLFTYNLPANSLDIVGRGVRMKAWGVYGANGNDKVIQILIGGTLAISSTVVTFNAGWWTIEAEFYKDGASTQNGTGTVITKNTVIGPETLLLGATDTAPIALTVTGASPTTGAANDVVANGMVVEFLN